VSAAGGGGMSALLLGADYFGTLAAVRCLGSNGYAVYVADERPRARALYSRWAREKATHPSIGDVDRFLEWLVAFGDAHEGTVLYPTNDHVSWLFARHASLLSQHFLTYQPSEDAILTLLDKKRLADACAAVGIETPRTLYAEDDAALTRVEKEARYPLLIKPRTQIYLETGIKGAMVHDAAELERELARYNSLVRFNRVLMDAHPDIARPLFQEYLTAAETSIFSMSGFVTEDGELLVRASMKVLQRPRKVGIGLCFEGRAIEPELKEKLTALCKHVGYYGAFEVEFIADGDRRLLIDFNPRFFSQMAFDVARGLPIPLLVYHAARGDVSGLASELELARRAPEHTDYGYCHKTILDLVLTLQRASGQMSKSDVERWRAWVKERRGKLTDAVRDDADRLPGVVDAALWAKHFAKHPRSFVRDFVLNR
jgi:predicted ATP-grasp superfamily ATP-dependent carboligase